jgi:hypothetical protein
MNMLFLPEGPGWSPDGGRFWVKDGKSYWEDGDITDLSIEGHLFRTMPGNASGEDYSAWSEEKRSAEKAKNALLRDRYAKEVAELSERDKMLVESARSKLTEDEFEAVARSAGS